MNIEKILNCLVPEYQIRRNESEIVPEIDIDIPKTDFSNTGFINFFSCILHHLNLEYDVEIKTITDNLEKYEYVELLNKKKVIMSIEQNTVNNTVKLFLAMHYNINIYEYHEKSKVLKVYYPEDEMYVSKKSILIFYNQCDDIYQTTIDTNITYDYINKKLPAILTVAIGLTIDKKFRTCTVAHHYDFVVGEVMNNDDWINIENIIQRKPTVELYVPETFDWRTFDIHAFNNTFIESLNSIKSINDSFVPKNLLIQLYSLKSQK